MSNTIASQLIRNNFSRFTMMFFQQSLEETLSCCSIASRLKKHINHPTILVYSPPQILLFTRDPYKNLIKIECVSKPLMSVPQPIGILRTELIAPQTNRFVAYAKTSFS